MDYVLKPKFKLLFNSGVDVYTGTVGLNFQMNSYENGFLVATITLHAPALDELEDIVTVGTDIQYQVKDSSEGGYTEIFNGVIRFVTQELRETGEVLIVKCDGLGSALADTIIGQEYGNQSKLGPVDTLLEILTDATYGMIPKWVKKVLNTAEDSGYAYLTTDIEDVSGTIKYIKFPWKPCDKAITDLCDLLTAMNAPTYATPGAGPHWYVDSAGCIHLKLISSDRANWKKYAGAAATQASATLVQGFDFTDFSLEKMQPEANLVMYNGIFRRPGDGDSWTDYGCDLHWEKDGAYPNISVEPTITQVGDWALKMWIDAEYIVTAFTPTTQDAAWDFNKLSRPMAVPTLNFYARCDNLSGNTVVSPAVRLCTDKDNYFEKELNADLTEATWNRFQLPIGGYYRQYAQKSGFEWVEVDPDVILNWNNINFIAFAFYTNTYGDVYFYVDGLYFGDVPIVRIAKDGTKIASDHLKVKVVTDNQAHDDALSDTDDSGLMARAAYAELLRLAKTSRVGTLTIPYTRYVKPGQLVHVHAKKNSGGTFKINDDFRVTKIVDQLSAGKWIKTLHVTDDLTNARVRPAYDSLKRANENQRPEFQDKQSTSLKTGSLALDTPTWTKDYDPP